VSDAYRPQPGDIGITRISGAGGKVIRFAQWLNGDSFKDYEHAFVVVKPRGLYVAKQIVEAMPGGAVEVQNWHAPAETVYLRCPRQYREAVAQNARYLVGTPYSYLDYASIATHRLHIRVPLLKRYVASSRHMICSQLADYAAWAAGWEIFQDKRWPGDVTPGDLYEKYEDQPGW